MEEIRSEHAPSAIGPYSQAVKSGNFLFCSGQIPLNVDGSFLDGDIEVQTLKVLENLGAVLRASGLDFSKVVKTTIYLLNIDDFAKVNEIYSEHFNSEVKPARSTVSVKNLPKGALVEIDCIAEF